MDLRLGHRFWSQFRLSNWVVRMRMRQDGWESHQNFWALGYMLNMTSWQGRIVSCTQLFLPYQVLGYHLRQSCNESPNVVLENVQ